MGVHVIQPHVPEDEGGIRLVGEGIECFVLDRFAVLGYGQRDLGGVAALVVDGYALGANLPVVPVTDKLGVAVFQHIGAGGLGGIDGGGEHLLGSQALVDGGQGGLGEGGIAGQGSFFAAGQNQHQNQQQGNQLFVHGKSPSWGFGGQYSMNRTNCPPVCKKGCGACGKK